MSTPPAHQRLATRREQADIPLRAMARKLCISHTYLLEMERGSRPMSGEWQARYNAMLPRKQRKPSVRTK